MRLPCMAAARGLSSMGIRCRPSAENIVGQVEDRGDEEKGKGISGRSGGGGVFQTVKGQHRAQGHPGTQAFVSPADQQAQRGDDEECYVLEIGVQGGMKRIRPALADEEDEQDQHEQGGGETSRPAEQCEADLWCAAVHGRGQSMFVSSC